MAGNDDKIEGKQQARSPHDQAQRIIASSMSKIYDSLEFDVSAAQSGYASLKGLANGALNGATIANVIGAAFVNHKRAHTVQIRTTETVRFKFNSDSNPIVTVGTTGVTLELKTLELEDIFFEAQDAARIEVLLS